MHSNNLQSPTNKKQWKTCHTRLHTSVLRSAPLQFSPKFIPDGRGQSQSLWKTSSLKLNDTFPTINNQGGEIRVPSRGGWSPKRPRGKSSMLYTLEVQHIIAPVMVWRSLHFDNLSKLFQVHFFVCSTKRRIENLRPISCCAVHSNCETNCRSGEGWTESERVCMFFGVANFKKGEMFVWNHQLNIICPSMLVCKKAVIIYAFLVRRGSLMNHLASSLSQVGVLKWGTNIQKSMQRPS